MRRGNLIILLLAIAMGGLAAFMARSWIQQHSTPAVVAKTGTIVVAGAPLAFGTVLTDDNVSEIPWAASQVPDGAFATKGDLFKEGRRVVLAAMERSDLILKSKVTGPGQRASLSALLESGKRAVAVRVDDVRGVAGFVLPGDRVDVVLIRTESRQGAQENYSDILVENMRVLAVDQIASERQEKATVAKAVTLEATTEQAQKILLATNVGRLSLILRQTGEARAGFARRVTESDLGIAEIRKVAETPVPLAQPAAAVEAPPPPPPPRAANANVIIFHGTKRETYSVLRTDED